MVERWHHAWSTLCWRWFGALLSTRPCGDVRLRFGVHVDSGVTLA